MCGRYFCADDTEDRVEEELGLERGALSMKAGDVTPGMNPVVLSASRDGDKDEIRVSDMLWGLSGKDNKLIINARAESALDKPMFSGSIEHRRCILPAAGFYEWDKDRNKVTFFREDGRPIYLAGFYQISNNRDSFVILTTAANESMIRVHDRMPLMIDKSQVRTWLGDQAAAKDMLRMEMPLLKSRQEYEQLILPL